MCLKKNNELTEQFKLENAGKRVKGYKILKHNADGWESPFYNQLYFVGENRPQPQHRSYQLPGSDIIDIGLHLFTTLEGVYRSFQFIEVLRNKRGYNSYSIGPEQNCYIVEVEYSVDDLTAIGVWNDYITEDDALTTAFVKDYPTDQVVVTRCFISETAFENAIKVE